MATGMTLWRINPNGTASQIEEERLATEEMLESAIESAPELLGMDVLIVGRQTQTPSGPLDLLALNADGHLVVIENKRHRTPREVLAQTIDYAAWASTLTFSEVEAIFAKFQSNEGATASDLAEAFEEKFGEPLESIGDVPQMVIVAAHLDSSTERMIDFLLENFDVPVNAALFQPFAGGLIGRTWLRPEAELSQTAGKRSTSNSLRREEARLFWEKWLPIGRPILPDIDWPRNAPRSVWFKRSISSVTPATLQLWVSSAEAHAEIQFDDEDPAINAALLEGLATSRNEIESSYGSPLEWRGPDSSTTLTKRTKVVGPKINIGQRVEPTAVGMEQLADSARSLVDAVSPHLADAAKRAHITRTSFEPTDTDC